MYQGSDRRGSSRGSSRSRNDSRPRTQYGREASRARGAPYPRGHGSQHRREAPVSPRGDFNIRGRAGALHLARPTPTPTLAPAPAVDEEAQELERKRLELKEREIAFKEKELALKEKELEFEMEKKAAEPYKMMIEMSERHRVEEVEAEAAERRERNTLAAEQSAYREGRRSHEDQPPRAWSSQAPRSSQQGTYRYQDDSLRIQDRPPQLMITAPEQQAQLEYQQNRHRQSFYQAAPGYQGHQASDIQTRATRAFSQQSRSLVADPEKSRRNWQYTRSAQKSNQKQLEEQEAATAAAKKEIADKAAAKKKKTAETREEQAGWRTEMVNMIREERSLYGETSRAWRNAEQVLGMNHSRENVTIFHSRVTLERDILRQADVIFGSLIAQLEKGSDINEEEGRALMMSVLEHNIPDLAACHREQRLRSVRQLQDLFREDELGPLEHISDASMNMGTGP